MSKWSIFWAGVKGVFTFNVSGCIFEAVTDYALGYLNSFLANENVSANVAKAYGTARSALDLLDKYSDWCPTPWRLQFEAIRDCVSVLVGVFADGKVEKDEITKVTEAYQLAYAKWTAD